MQNRDATDAPRSGSSPGGRNTLTLLAVLILLFSTAASWAKEQSEQFVAGLRDRGLYELTLDYLAEMETSPLAETAFKQRIAFLRGVTLIDEARQTTDADEQSKLLDRAHNELDRFVAANPASADGAEAQTQLATMLVEQAKRIADQASQLPAGTAYNEQREKQRAAARQLLDQAQPMFKSAATYYTAAIDKLPKTADPKLPSDQGDSRQDLRGRLAQVNVLAAQSRYAQAATYPTDSKKFRELNEAAAKELSDLFDQYSRWLVGFYARLYEGRCYQALGDYQRAQGCYEEIISQSSVTPAFRKLIASAYAYQTECQVAQKKYDEAIAGAKAWLGVARGSEAQEPEWLALRYQFAGALQAKAEAASTTGAERRKLTAEAREAYRLVANSPGEFQRLARAAGASLTKGDEPRKDQPRDFRAAYEAGKEAMASVNAATMALPSAEKNNPSAVPDLQAQAEEGKEEARRNFRLALGLVDEKTDRDQLNEVRYFLCWLYWNNEQYYEAAALGEFLARRYSDHPSAAAAAKLALASYDRLYRSAGQSGGKRQDTEFESRHMAQIAEFITRRWPGSPTAEAATRILVSYAIRNDRVDDARAMLGQVSATARPALESQLGNAMWGRYLELSQADSAERPDEAKLQKLRAEALAMLQSGFDDARKSGSMSESAATSGLYLAQSLLGDGKYAEAIALFEEPKSGPLSLVISGSEAAQRPEFAIEVYKGALRAYLSVTPPQGKKAVDILTRLDAAAAATGDDKGDQLARIHLGLIKLVQQQIQQLRDAHQDAEAAKAGASLSDFLDRVALPEADGSWSGRYLIAQVFFLLGETARDDATLPLAIEKPADGRARDYFVKARDGYRRLLTDAEKDSSVATSPAAILVIKKQLGECNRQLGQYKAALEMFTAVLQEKESELSVQRSAAYAYQGWGETDDPKWLENAIQGSDKIRGTGKNRIWGWLRLAQVAERASRTNPQYRGMFFEARLEAARCRFLAAAKADGDAQKQQLDTAKQSIRSMLPLYPDLGGDAWRGKFDDLVKLIQKMAGDETIGLKEFAAAEKATSAEKANK